MKGSATSLISIADWTRVTHIDGFEGALQGQAVNDGRQHPHIIGHGPVRAPITGLQSPEDIAAPDDDPQLHAQRDDLFNFTGDVTHHLRINAEDALPHQGFTAEFQEDSTINRFFH